MAEDAGPDRDRLRRRPDAWARYVEPSAADELERALGDGRDGALALDAEDGRYTVALRRDRLRQALRARRPRRLQLRLRRVSGTAAAGQRLQGERRTREPHTADLRRLVELAQQGDREALEALYLLHFDRIYSYLHMSVGNRHDAEDLTTQTFLKMLEAIGRFRWQSAPFSAWLFRIAHNLAMDHFRATRRWQPEEEVPEPEGAAESSAEDDGAAVDRPQEHARADREPLARAAAGADAEVPLQLLERRGRRRSSTSRRAPSSRSSIALSRHCRSSSPQD